VIKRAYRLIKSTIWRKIMFFLVVGFILPVLFLNVYILNLMNSDLTKQTIQSYLTVNQQLALNVEGIITSVASYTSYPYYNQEFLLYFSKVYRPNEPDYQFITTDNRMYKASVHSQLIRYNDNIYSSLLYNKKSESAFWTSRFSVDLRSQIIDRIGDLSVVDGSLNHLASIVLNPLTQGTELLVLISRPIYDTVTQDYLGYFCLGIDGKTFADLVNVDTAKLSGVKQYIVDQNNCVIYSTDASEIGSELSSDLQYSLNKTSTYSQLERSGESVSFIKHQTNDYGWTIVSEIKTDILLQKVKAEQLRMYLELATKSAEKTATQIHKSRPPKYTIFGHGNA